MTEMTIFKIKREEIIASTIALLVFVALNIVMMLYHYELFTRGGNLGFWGIFHAHFMVSGFDVFTYITISHWGNFYALYRHPLLAIMMYPLFLVNGFLMSLFKFNFTIYIVAILLVMCSFYSYVFLYRIFRNVMDLNKNDAIILSALFFSFAYIMLTVMVPDHFCFSMFFLLMVLSMVGDKIKRGAKMKSWQTMILFFLTSGVTLTNGFKVLIAALFSNGRQFFSNRNLFIAVIFPALLLIGVYYLQCYYILWPEEKVREARGAERLKTDSVFAKAQAEHKQWMKTRMKNPTGNKYLEWVDFSSSRSDAIIENLFGESIQLHNQYLLQDTNISRPVIVKYSWSINYLVEIIIVILFVMGIWCGRHSRFLWLCMSWFTFDMFIYLIMGFGIIEVYIMAAHWIFVIPISIGYIFKTLDQRYLIYVRLILSVLSVYLYCYNGLLIMKYFFNELF